MVCILVPNWACLEFLCPIYIVSELHHLQFPLLNFVLTNKGKGYDAGFCWIFKSSNLVHNLLVVSTIGYSELA